MRRSDLPGAFTLGGGSENLARIVNIKALFEAFPLCEDYVP
jgi:hypothetical protein